jgi:hypothetical protein
MISLSRALTAYLTAWTFATTIAIGGLGLLLLSYATGARWMAPLRRILEATASALIPLALLFLPIALALPWVYPWAEPGSLHHQRTYLSPAFFVGRTAAYLGLWIVAGEILRGWGRRARLELDRERAFASAMLPLVGVTVSFAGFDWLMSLQPAWWSAGFGLIFLTGALVAAGAVTILGAAYGRRRALAGVVTGHHFHALGRLLLAFTVVWGYLQFFQAMLIQAANRPDEVTFYLHRTQHGWGWIALVLGVGHLGIPLFALLPRRAKHRPRYLVAIAVWLLVMH